MTLSLWLFDSAGSLHWQSMARVLWENVWKLDGGQRCAGAPVMSWPHTTAKERRENMGGLVWGQRSRELQWHLTVRVECSCAVNADRIIIAPLYGSWYGFHSSFFCFYEENVFKKCCSCTFVYSVYWYLLLLNLPPTSLIHNHIFHNWFHYHWPFRCNLSAPLCIWVNTREAGDKTSLFIQRLFPCKIRTTRCIIRKPNLKRQGNYINPNSTFQIQTA